MHTLVHTFDFSFICMYKHPMHFGINLQFKLSLGSVCLSVRECSFFEGTYLHSKLVEDMQYNQGHRLKKGTY